VNEEIQSIAAVLNVVAVVAVAVFVHRATAAANRVAGDHERYSAQIEFDRELKNSWMSVDTEALASDEALKVFDELLHPEAAGSASIEERRRRWASYLLLNVLALSWSGIQKGLADSNAVASLERSLRAAVQDDTFFYIARHYPYEPGFVALCEQLRNGSSAVSAAQSK